MKTFSMLSLTLGVALIAGSCNNSTGGRGTPIDSTNDYGTAPVQYESGAPTTPVDTTMHSQPADQRSRQDNSVNNSMPQTSDTTAPAPSNTDKSTTSGSSNGRK